MKRQANERTPADPVLNQRHQYSSSKQIYVLKSKKSRLQIAHQTRFLNMGFAKTTQTQTRLRNPATAWGFQAKNHSASSQRKSRNKTILSLPAPSLPFPNFLFFSLFLLVSAFFFLLCFIVISLFFRDCEFCLASLLPSCFVSGLSLATFSACDCKRITLFQIATAKLPKPES